MQVPILCYHKVGPIAQEGRWLNIESARLQSHVRFFMRRGYRSVVAGDVPSSFGTRAVCFTFDDAYVSAVERGVEVLLSEGASGTFYAVPSLVGGASVWDGERARPLADWPALITAAAKGMEIGNHTMTHARLPELSMEGQLREWEDADRALNEHGLAARSACFPYGVFDSVTLQVLEKLGYESAVCIGKRRARKSDPPLALPRIVMAYSDGIPKLLYKLYIRPALGS